MTCPTLAPHGGIRVILEWANHLPDVVVRVPKVEPVDWMRVAPHVRLVESDEALEQCGTLIVSSPHGVEYLTRRGVRRFVFLQMLEHLFRPNNRTWQHACAKAYRTDDPLILISGWNERVIRTQFRRRGPIEQVGNGIDLTDFPIERVKKSGDVVLVEGWDAGNVTKDVDGIGPKVAARLKADGCTIVAYGRNDDPRTPGILDEYHAKPDLATLNDLYRKATILLKATRYDARSCAPVEAMTKGTVTARAIVEGDDDLDATNSIRVGYDQRQLYRAARRLLDDEGLRAELSENCIRYAEEHSWDKMMPRIRAVLSV